MSVYQNISSRTLIEKGWSGDRKYCAVTADGQKYLLRISTIDRLERKRREYEKMWEVAQLGIPMCLPVEFGTCDEGAYSIQSWIDGVDAEETGLSANLDTSRCASIEYPISSFARKQVAFFLGEVTGVPIVRDGEIDKFKWVTAEVLQDYLFPDTYEACKALLR